MTQRMPLTTWAGATITSPGGRDRLLVAGLTLLALTTFVRPDVTVGMEIPGPGSTGPQPWWAAVVLGLTLPLLGRRRRPGAVLLVVSTVFVVRVLSGAGPTAADVAPLVAVDAVVAYGTRWGLLTLCGYAAGHLAAVWAIPALRAELTGAVVVADAAIFLVAPSITGLARRRAAAPAGTAAPAEAAPPAHAAPPARPGRHAALTAREGDVLAELGRGATNAEIAARLGVSPETVKTHVRQVVAKLGVRDRTAAALLAPTTYRSGSA